MHSVLFPSRWFLVSAALACFLLIPSCGGDGTTEKDGEVAAAGDACDDHAHTPGPHGGELMGTDDHQAYVELLFDHDAGQITLYTLKEDKESPLPLDKAPLVNIKTPDGPRQFTSRSLEEGSGPSARFEVRDAALEGIEPEGQVVLALNGTEHILDIHHHHESEGGQVHEHGEDCDHAHGENTVSYTAWTDACEWFVELDTPVKDHDAAFAAHVTLLDTFAPARSGVFKVEARSGGQTASTAADAPARPGIFTPSIRFPAAGEWTLTLTYEAGELSDSTEWRVTVHDEAPAHPAEEEGQAKTISFLKEQQWKIAFATAWPVGDDVLRVPASAVITAEEGQIVFVQVDGESFSRRSVMTGAEEGGLIEIRTGLKKGDRIVVKGAEFLAK